MDETLRTAQRALTEDRLTRIETKLDIFLEDHEKRLRSLEKENWLHRGGLALAAFIAAKLNGYHL